MRNCKCSGTPCTCTFEIRMRIEEKLRNCIRVRRPLWLWSQFGTMKTNEQWQPWRPGFTKYSDNWPFFLFSLLFFLRVVSESSEFRLEWEQIVVNYGCKHRKGRKSENKGQKLRPLVTLQQVKAHFVSEEGTFLIESRVMDTRDEKAIKAKKAKKAMMQFLIALSCNFAVDSKGFHF